MKIIAVTGTPGTGKTTLSKKLAKKKDYFYLDVTEFIKEGKLHDGYDRSKRCYIVDEKKLTNDLENFFKFLKAAKVKGIVVDSHMSHYLPSKLVDQVIVTKCDINVLNRRLKKRGYGKQKIRDNLDSEIFNVCFEESKERKHNVKVVDTNKGIKNL